MSNTKYLCSADEYAYLKKSYDQFTAQLNKAKSFVPGTAAYETIPGAEASVRLFSEALDAFAVAPGSQATGQITLSVEFQENFKKLKSEKPLFKGFVLRED